MVDLKVVSERPAQEIKKQKALLKLGSVLRDLTANLMRVVRGAGKPELIELHALQVSEAFELYRREIGSAPVQDDLTTALHFPMPDEESDRLNEAFAEYVMQRCALQVVASTLLAQRTLISTSSYEFITLARNYDRIHKREKRKRRAARVLVRKPPTVADH